MDKPSIHLMVKHFVTHEQNAGKHVFDNWVATHASLMDCVQQLSSSQTMLLNISVKLSKCRE